MMGRAVLALCALTSTALACPRREHTESTTSGAAVAFALMGFCVCAYMLSRRNAVRRTFATSRHLVDVDLAAMQHVARVQRSRTGLFALGCALLVSAITALPLSAHETLSVAAAPAILFAIAMIGWCQLQMLIHLRAEPDLRVTSHGDYMFVARGKRLVGWLGAPPALLARATALPLAKLHR